MRNCSSRFLPWASSLDPPLWRPPWPTYFEQLNAAGMAEISAELDKLQYTVEELITCSDSGCMRQFGRWQWMELSS